MPGRAGVVAGAALSLAAVRLPGSGVRLDGAAGGGDPVEGIPCGRAAVAPGSLADKAGLHALDVIWQVNGTRVVDLASIKAALLLGNAGDSLALMVRRYKFTPDGDFVPKLGQDGKPALDATGCTQWEFEEISLSLKRGTVTSLGLMAPGNVTGIGIGLVPATPLAK